MKMWIRRSILVISVIVLSVAGIGLTSSGGWCPDCTYCPPEYSEEIGSGNCVQCDSDQCWILWPITRGWPWTVNAAKHMQIPGTSYDCWHTWQCFDDDCLPFDC